MQVKSEGFSWNLGTPDAVKWFLDHPTPLFLCIVEKNRGRVSIYQTMVRFLLAAEAFALESIELVPGGQGEDPYPYGAALMAMADRWLQREFPDVFKHGLFANGGPGELFQTVRELGERYPATYVFAGVDALLDYIAYAARVAPEQSAPLSPEHAEQPWAEDAAQCEPPSTPIPANPDGCRPHRVRRWPR